MLNRTSLVNLFVMMCLFAITTPGIDDSVKSKIEKLISVSGAEIVSVAYYDLETGREIFINERVSLHAASTMKVPVMMELFRLESLGQLDLNSKIKVENQFHSIVDGSQYSLTVADDSDPDVYKLIGQEATINYLIDRMITMSSNLATNLLIEKANASNVNKLMRELGAMDIQVRRGVEDGKAFKAGLNNTTTAYDLMLIMKAISEAKFQNKKNCDRMIEIMADQKFNEGIPAGLKKGTKVAHKTGNITKHTHDAAIVLPPHRKPYVLVVLVKGIEDQARASKLIADISSLIFKSL